MTDGGSENLGLDRLANTNHVIAQVDVVQSNSLVEALWSQLRHRWLYQHTLDAFEALQRLVGKYFADHNAIILRAELGGRTPDEAFAGIERTWRRDFATGTLKPASRELQSTRLGAVPLADPNPRSLCRRGFIASIGVAHSRAKKVGRL